LPTASGKLVAPWRDTLRVRVVAPAVVSVRVIDGESIWWTRDDPIDHPIWQRQIRRVADLDVYRVVVELDWSRYGNATVA
jgi:hypothetical protein